VYLHKNASPSDLDRFKQIYEQAPPETKGLSTLTPPNLNHQAPSDEQVNMELEKASIYFQNLIREEVTQHWQREQQAQKEIWPAAPPTRYDTTNSEEDIDFCSGLACAPTGQSTQIVW
jgi:predicted Abi (CAAX) family protease